MCHQRAVRAARRDCAREHLLLFVNYTAAGGGLVRTRADETGRGRDARGGRRGSLAIVDAAVVAAAVAAAVAGRLGLHRRVSRRGHRLHHRRLRVHRTQAVRWDGLDTNDRGGGARGGGRLRHSR